MVLEQRLCFAVKSCHLYLVEHILLRAQVEVWQDSCGPNISHRQAGLGQAHRQSCGRFPLTQARETGRECSKTSCRERGEGQNRLDPLTGFFFFFFTQNGYTRAGNSKDLSVNAAPPLADGHSIAFLRPQCRGLGLLPATGAKTEAVCACSVHFWAARNVHVWPFKRQLRFWRMWLSVSCMSSCPVAEHCVRLGE